MFVAAVAIGVLALAAGQRPFLPPRGVMRFVAYGLVAALQVPLLSRPLRLVDPGREGWILIGTLSPLPLVVGRLLSVLHRSSDAD